MTVPVAVAQPWRDRVALVNLIGAEAISNIGSRMSFFAIPWLVLVTTGDPVKIGLVAGAESLAYLVSGVLAAPLVDRLGARLSSIGSDVASVAIMATIATFGQLDFRILVVLVTLLGVMRSQGDRAKITLVVPLMGRAGDYTRVASVRDGALRSSGLIGSAVAGVAIAFLGATGALWLDAASFAIAAALVAAAVPSTEQATEPTERTEASSAETTSTAETAGATEGAAQPAQPEKATDSSYFGSLRSGFAWFRANRLLRAITGMLFLTSLFNQAAMVVFVPLWVQNHMDDAKALGAISTAYTIGVIAGSAVFAWLAPVLPRYPTLVAGYIIGSAPRFLILALSDNLAVVLAVSLLCGIAMCTANPTVTTAIYQRTPKEMLTRGGGIITAIAFGGLPIGGLVGGVLVQTLGLTNGILVISLLFLLVTLAPVAGYALWREVNDTASKRPSPGNTTALHRLYAAGSVVTGLRLNLRYADGRWSVVVRRGLRTVVRRQPVEPKVAVTALNRLDFEPVHSALNEVLHRDKVMVSRRAHRVRQLVRPAEARLADLSMISTLTGRHM